MPRQRASSGRSRPSAARRNGLASVAVILAGLGLCACTAEPREMPSDAPGVADYERRPFGDVIAAVDTRAWIDVLDQLKSRNGGRTIRWLPRMLDAAVGPEAVRRHYAGVLEADGWTPIPLPADFRNESWSYGWQSRNGGDVFAVVGLVRERAAAGFVPFNILTTLPDARR